MNAGLSNLATLKGYLLPGTMQSDTQFDAKLALIGLGVAGLMETFCNRLFAYAAGDTVIFTGDRPHFYLPRYPFVSVAAVEMRYFDTDGWTAIDGQPIQTNPGTGLIQFGFEVGRRPLQVRVTYTGGYFYETKESTDIGYPTAVPSGATALPATVQLAWLTQCAEHWNKSDKLGAGLISEPDREAATGALKLSPGVREMLQPFIRYQLT